MEEKLSQEQMWKVIEQYGITREIFKSGPTEETIRQLYMMIKKYKEMNREDELVRLLRQYIENMKNRT